MVAWLGNTWFLGAAAAAVWFSRCIVVLEEKVSWSSLSEDGG
jgi:hypothetical protein